MPSHKLPDSSPPWPQFATGVSLSDDESDDDGTELDGDPVTEEMDDCLGPDDPGVGPWILDFSD